MFAVDTNIFFWSSNIKKLFENINKELAIRASRINCGLIQAKQIHKQTNWNNIPLKLPILSYYYPKRVTELKFVGVMVDKNLKKDWVPFKGSLHLIRHTYPYILIHTYLTMYHIYSLW